MRILQNNFNIQRRALTFTLLTITAAAAFNAAAQSSSSPAPAQPEPPSAPAQPRPQPTQAPSGLTAVALSATQISLQWNASTTSGVTYNVYSSLTSGFTPAPANLLAANLTATNFLQQGLNPATSYYYVVTAVLGSTESAPSNPAVTTTPLQPPTSAPPFTCQVAYNVVSQWNTGFTGSIAVTNTSNADVSSWTLTWLFPGNQQITSAWNANFTQTTTAVTLTNMSYNGSVAAGATLSGIGFNANFSDTNSLPASISLNGTVCSAGPTPATLLPIAPTNVTAAVLSSVEIQLDWTASTSSGATYNVYEGIAYPNGSARATIPVATGLTTTSLVRTGLDPNATYYYYVTAVNVNGESAPSALATAVTPASFMVPVPTSLTAASISTSEIDLAWAPVTSPTAGQATYNVYVATAANPTRSLVASGLAPTTYQHQGLLPGTLYTYTVTAVVGGVESPTSAPATATTNPYVISPVQGPGCHLTYNIVTDWGTGFTANISITNTGGESFQNWVLSWTWPATQQISTAWNAALTQNGDGVTLASEPYNATIDPGATLSGIGFNVTATGPRTAPQNITLNGYTCQ